MEVKQFLELFTPYPGSCYLEVSQDSSEITTALYDLLEQSQSTLDLVFYENEKKEHKQRFINSKIQYIDSFEKPFRALPRSVDIVILRDILHYHKKQDVILKTAYRALANTADIIIMEKKGVMNIAAMCELLEQYEFRASNSIDIFAEYDLVMAKKMHMWGNGL